MKPKPKQQNRSFPIHNPETAVLSQLHDQYIRENYDLTGKLKPGALSESEWLKLNF